MTLVRARRELEQDNWPAAPDLWSGVDPEGMSGGDLYDAGLAAYLLGRRETSLDFS